MTDKERFKQFRKLIINGDDIPRDFLDWLVDQWKEKIGDINPLMCSLENAGYFGDEEYPLTRQARRQYVFDCVKACRVLPLGD